MIQSLYQYETEVVTIEYITEAQLAKELREKYMKNPPEGMTSAEVNITVRQSRQSGVARATCPD